MKRDLLETAFVAGVVIAFTAWVFLEVIDVPALVAKISGAG